MACKVALAARFYFSTFLFYSKCAMHLASCQVDWGTRGTQVEYVLREIGLLQLFQARVTYTAQSRRSLPSTASGWDEVELIVTHNINLWDLAKN